VLDLDEKIYQANTKPMLSHINVGTGVDVTIREMAELVKRVVGFKGDIIFDTSKPDGTLRKLIDVSRLSDMGWTYNVGLEEGLQKTYTWYVEKTRNENQY
jgi:GDP-L-fucose synthase